MIQQQYSAAISATESAGSSTQSFVNAMRGTCLAVLFLLTASCSEYLPTPMGPLEGSVVVLPASWSQVAKTKIIQFETTGVEGQYSVNLWIVEMQGVLHVFAGDNHTTWVQNIEANPAVRLGVQGDIFELQASRVTDAVVFEQFAQAWEAKYGNRPRNENVNETYLMRLLPRS